MDSETKRFLNKYGKIGDARTKQGKIARRKAAAAKAARADRLEAEAPGPGSILGGSPFDQHPPSIKLEKIIEPASDSQLDGVSPPSAQHSFVASADESKKVAGDAELALIERLKGKGRAPTQGDLLMARFLDKYGKDPVLFVVEVLKVRPKRWQRELLEAVAVGERRISVRAGHGIGKTAVCAWLCVWAILVWYPQKTVVTAPTASQLFDALFVEIKKWVDALPPYLRNLLETFSDRIVLKEKPEKSFIAAKTASAERPEAMSGVHEAEGHVLLICDEASAIPEPVYENGMGSMSGHEATTILIGNPTRNSGMFYQTHHKLARGPETGLDGWKTMHVSCMDSSLVSRDYIRQIRDTYGEASNAYRVRVLGEFALHEDDTLIAAELVDAAMGRDIVDDPTATLVYGVDVARFGDDRTVLCKRRGNVVLELRVLHGRDLMEVVGWVVHHAKQDQPSEIMVDSIGLGAGVADRLREQKFNVRDVNVSEAAAMDMTASRLRDELWVTVKNWLGQRACRLPKDEELRLDLTSPTYSFLSNGRLKVEAKSDMKSRGLRSPDKADALCLTFAGQAALVGGRASSWIPGKPLKRNVLGVV